MSVEFLRSQQVLPFNLTIIDSFLPIKSLGLSPRTLPGIPPERTAETTDRARAAESRTPGRTVHDWVYFSAPEGVPGGPGNFNDRMASITLKVWRESAVESDRVEGGSQRSRP